MTAATKPARIRRGTQNGAALGRARILELLADGPHGLQWLQDEAHMSRLTLLQRLRELVDVVAVREDEHGNRMAGMRE